MPQIDGRALASDIDAGDWLAVWKADDVYGGLYRVVKRAPRTLLDAIYASAAQGALADTAVQPGSLATVAFTGNYSDLSGLPTLGTAAAADTGDFATAAQGALADTAVQPGSLATVAFTGNYSDLSGLPTLGTAAAADTGDFATAAQGALADSALQPAAIGVSLQAYNGYLQNIANLTPGAGTDGYALTWDNGSGAYVLASIASLLPVVDTTAIVKGSVDATKLLRFEIDGFTTATTRALTPQDASYTIAGLETVQTFTVAQTFGAAVNVNTVNGIDFNPGSDTDVDLITLDVTGTPKISWEEANDRLRFSHGFYVIDGDIRADHDGTNMQAVFSSYGNSTLFTGRRANGSQAAPTQALSGEELFQLGGAGYQSGGAWATTRARISFKAIEDWTAGAQGARLDFLTTAAGGTSTAQAMKIEGSGDVIITSTGDTAAGKLHVYQSSAVAAKPVLYLRQANNSERFIEFNATVGVGNAIEAVGAKTLTTTHFIKITITGVGTLYIPAGPIA